MAGYYKDYYETLGVAKTASQGDIRKAFRALARQHHPDVAKDKRSAEARFKEINEAYEVLGDAEKRRQYDDLGREWNQPGFHPPNGAGHPGKSSSFDAAGENGFSDFFEAFFGQGPGSTRRTGAGRRFRGGAGPAQRSDIEGELQIGVEEFFSGVRKRVRIQRRSGVAESVDVTVPAGIGVGQKVRVAGKGEHGGDVLLQIQAAPHPLYAAEGEDLVYRLRVSAWKLVLGAGAEIPTPDGTVRVQIPAGTQSEKRLRLRERGLPRRGGGRGDFYVQVSVDIPQQVGAEERALWERMRSLDVDESFDSGY
jgi:curved DNA-binding protein